MTDFNSFKRDDPRPIVYVREVKIAELPKEIQSQAAGQDHVYAIHADTGEVLALVQDRGQAFVIARQNSLAPVSVH